MRQYNLQEGLCLKGCTLVAAVPAVGNTGQLAVDLLVVLQQSRSQSGCLCAAILESNNVLPIVGNDAFARTADDVRAEMCSSLELYASEQLQEGCYLLQQRGPVATGRQAAFAEEFAAWAKEAGLAAVVLVSSLSAADREDIDIRGSQLCCCGPPHTTPAPIQKRLEAAGLPVWHCAAGDAPMERRKIAPWVKSRHFALDLRIFIAKSAGCLTCNDCYSSGGHAAHLCRPYLRECGRAELPCTALMAFSADSDNVAEAQRLAAACLHALQPQGAEAENQWHTPLSWPQVAG